MSHLMSCLSEAQMYQLHFCTYNQRGKHLFFIKNLIPLIMSKTVKTKEATLPQQNESNKLDAIRAILIGEQQQKTDLRIADVQNKLASLQKELDKAEQKFSDRLVALESSYASKYEALQQEVAEQMQHLQNSQEARSEQQKQGIAKLFIELGTKLQG